MRHARLTSPSDAVEPVLTRAPSEFLLGWDRSGTGDEPGKRLVDDSDPVRSGYGVLYRPLVTQLTALCGNLAEAEDIVRESFVAAMTRRRDFEEVVDKEAWLRTVALKSLRSRRRRARAAARVLPRFRGELSIDLGPEAPEHHVAIVYALSRLSLPVRMTVVLHYVADLSMTQVALELGVSEGIVMARLAQARAQIADQLVDREEADHV